MWYIAAPAASASRWATSATVVARSRRLTAFTASTQTSPASAASTPSSPSSSSTTSSSVTSDGGGERVAALDAAVALKDPRAAHGGEQALEELHGDVARPGDLADRHRAPWPRRASSASAFTADGDLVVIASTWH